MSTKNAKKDNYTNTDAVLLIARLGKALRLCFDTESENMLNKKLFINLMIQKVAVRICTSYLIAILISFIFSAGRACILFGGTLTYASKRYKIEV